MFKAFLLFAVFSMVGAFDVHVRLSSCNASTNCFRANHNDTVDAIQKALNLIRNNTGGRLILEKGTYLIGKNFDVFGNTTIIGQGINETIIKLKDYAAPFVRRGWKKAGVVRATAQNRGGCDNIAVLNLTLDGNKANQYNDSDHKYGRYGLFTEACVNTTFDRVEILNMQGYGFDPHGLKPDDYAYNLTVVNCIAHNNDWDGFTLDQTINVFVENCTAFNNGRHGFNIVTGTRNTIIKNVSTHNNGYYYSQDDPGCGIAMQDNLQYGTQVMHVTDAHIVNDKRAGVCTTWAIKNLTITNTKIHNVDRCVHIARNGSFVLVRNVTCIGASRFMMSSNVTNIVSFDNTLNGTIVKPIGVPIPSPSPRSPRSPRSPSPHP